MNKHIISEKERTTASVFLNMLEQQWLKENFVCVGLDSEYNKLPEKLKESSSIEDALFVFNRDIIDATYDLVCAYKPNSAFYEAHGDEGIRALARTVRYIKNRYAHIPVILDAKRADIGNTNLGYVSYAFDHLGADAMTVHPYLGKEALAPFLERTDKGIIIVAKTSNPGSGELQDLPVGETGELLYQLVARHVATQWNSNGNCAVVVGATYPSELAQVRGMVGDLPILIPGIGAQGGEVASIVKAGQDSRGWGMIINAARSIIFASSSSDDFAQEARFATDQLRSEINKHRGG